MHLITQRKGRKEQERILARLLEAGAGICFRVFLDCHFAFEVRRRTQEIHQSFLAIHVLPSCCSFLRAFKIIKHQHTSPTLLLYQEKTLQISSQLSKFFFMS